MYRTYLANECTVKRRLSGARIYRDLQTARHCVIFWGNRGNPGPSLSALQSCGGRAPARSSTDGQSPTVRAAYDNWEAPPFDGTASTCFDDICSSTLHGGDKSRQPALGDFRLRAY